MTHNADSNKNMLDMSSLQTINEISWHTLYTLLYSLIKRQVYAFRVPSWCGQENDIVDDIVQEAMRRVLERIQRAELGQEAPVSSVEHMIVVIARNYCRDLRRRDKRLIHASAQESLSAELVLDSVQMQNVLDLSEEATEQVYQEALFMQLAQEVAQFPNKQREALLVDLANRMSFEEQPTALQKAFLHAGIQLQDYQRTTPENVKQRARQVALLHHAYKRVAQLPQIHCHAEVA